MLANKRFYPSGIITVQSMRRWVKDLKRFQGWVNHIPTNHVIYRFGKFCRVGRGKHNRCEIWIDIFESTCRVRIYDVTVLFIDSLDSLRNFGIGHTRCAEGIRVQILK